ncbi:MAG: hypothetical protein SFW67_01145 [Myxococcaceae bacterium]|nr:hypothetical protein [Myxococcaceae bacterium]
MGLFDWFKKKPKAPPIPPQVLGFWVHRLSHFEALSRYEQFENLRFGAVGGVFGVTPATYTNEGPLLLEDKHLERLGLSREEAEKTAAMNVIQALSTASRAGPLAIWSGPAAESIITVAPFFAEKLGCTNPVVFVPREGLSVMASGDDLDALEHLASFAESEFTGAQYRSLRAVCWPDGETAQAFVPPREHPHFERFQRLIARTRLVEAHGVHEAYSSEADDPSPLAHLTVVGSELVGTWFRGADVVMPEVDRVVLFDVDGEGPARVEVDFETLRTGLPEALEPIDEDPESGDAKAYRLRGTVFPSPRMKAFLIARAEARRSPSQANPVECSVVDLLAAWDAGVPARATPLPQDGRWWLELRLPDGRQGLVPAEVMEGRLLALAANDQFAVRSGLIAATLLHLMEDQTSALLEPPEFMTTLAPRPVLPALALLSSNELRQLKRGGDDDEESLERVLVKTVADALEPSRLFAAVRPPGYEQGQAANQAGMLEGFRRSLSAEGPVEIVGAPTSLTRPAARGLTLELVSDRGDRMIPVNGQLMPPEFVDAAWRTLTLNLEASSLDPWVELSPGVFRSRWRDSYDLARLLVLPRLVGEAPVKGAPLVFAPTVSRAYLVGADDLDGLAAVLDEIDEDLGSPDAVSPYQYRELLFAWPWALHQGSLVKAEVVLPPAIAARVQAIDARLEKRRQTSTAHVEGFAATVYGPSTSRVAPEA